MFYRLTERHFLRLSSFNPPCGGGITEKKRGAGWWSLSHEGSTAAILAALQVSGGQLGDRGLRGEEGVVMVSGCHGDCEYSGNGVEQAETPVDGAHLVY